MIMTRFLADNHNACGLNISDIEYMTDTYKDLLDICV